MRTIQQCGLSMYGICVVLYGCGGSAQPSSTLSYTAATAVYTQGVPITPNSPLSTGAVVASYSASPALPAGLNLSSATGVISGTPTAVTASASYTITASSAGGSATAILTLVVIEAPVAQLLPNM